MSRRDLLGLFGWLLLAYATSAIGAVASVNAVDFYGQLVQPDWAPPSWLFGPVWTLLYTLMGISAWLVWRDGGLAANPLAFGLFFGQLGLNALWSWLFFTWQEGALAFAEIIGLWSMILATLILFWQARPLAGMLLVPYLLWVGFAAALNFVLWQGNPGLL